MSVVEWKLWKQDEEILARLGKSDPTHYADLQNVRTDDTQPCRASSGAGGLIACRKLTLCVTTFLLRPDINTPSSPRSALCILTT